MTGLLLAWVNTSAAQMRARSVRAPGGTADRPSRWLVHERPGSAPMVDVPQGRPLRRRVALRLRLLHLVEPLAEPGQVWRGLDTRHFTAELPTGHLFQDGTFAHRPTRPEHLSLFAGEPR